MPSFSPAQSARINEAATRIAHQRSIIVRLEGELEIAKQNLKSAKTEMEFALNELADATQSALAGKEPLPNLFAREAKG